MRVDVTKWGNTLSSVYYLNADEKIPRHQHPVAHTTACLYGRMEVEVWDGRPVEVCASGSPTIELPPKIDHEIRSIEDGTIILNIIENINSIDPPPTYTFEEPKHAGVLLVDGTIVS